MTTIAQANFHGQHKRAEPIDTGRSGTLLFLKSAAPAGRFFMKGMERNMAWAALVLALACGAGVQAAQDSGVFEAKVKTLMVDPASQSPVVVLETVTDKKLLPIWIDVPEARAIALELENVKLPRPLTHDLIRNLLQTLGATLQRVTITDLRNNTYFAVLTLTSRGQELQVDSRPSDAIAIALRMKAPIFATAQVLAKSKPLPPQPARAEQTQKRLGIQVQDLTADLAALLESQQQKGVVVNDVGVASNAMKAGVQRGDIITKANDQVIQSTADLDAVLQKLKPTSQLKLEVTRKGKPMTIVVDLSS
jgi:bifunctional DNase/RNase